MGVRNDEGAVVKACLDYLRLLGVWAWRQNQGAVPLKGGGYRRFVGMPGLSDILGVLPMEAAPEPGCPGGAEVFGVMLAVECKKPGGKVRPDQEAFLARLNESGGVGLLVSSVEELQAKLAPFMAVARRAA
jgi:hypothetical protein